MAAQKPAEFLNQDPVSVSVSTTGSWSDILAHEQLTASTINTDVLIVANKFWGLPFTSDRNAAYFKSVPTADKAENNAWVGDVSGSGVMLLQAPTTPWQPVGLKDVVCATFGVNFENKSLMGVFLGFVDAQGLLKATLVAPPIILMDPTTKQSALSLTVDSGKPTNAIWCMTAGDAYYSILSLSYAISGVDDLLNKAISWITSKFDNLVPKLPTVSLPDATVTLTRRSRFSFKSPTADSAIQRSVTLSFAFKIIDFNINIDLSDDGRVLTLTPVDSGSITDILNAIKSALGTPQNVVLDLIPSSDSNNPFVSIFDTVHLWYIQITDDTTKPNGRRLQWGIGLITIWKIHGADIVVTLTYDSASSTFVGRLLTQEEYANARDLRNPNWDPRLSPSSTLTVSGVDPLSLGQGVDLWKLLDLDIGAQPPIPHIIKFAMVSFSRPQGSMTGSLFSFSADIVKDNTEPTPGQGGAPTGFSWDEAALQLSVVSPQDKTQDKTYSVDVFSTFTLVGPAPPPGQPPPFLPATFALGLHCDKTGNGRTWLLRASVQNLSVGLIRSFFEESAQEGAMAVMDKINLKSLDIIYTYQGAIASSFIMTGVLALGDLELLLSYQHVSALLGPNDATATQTYSDENPKGGSLPPDTAHQYKKGNNSVQSKFVARLSVSSPNSTIKSIANSIVPNAGDRLPTWVSGIPVNPTTPTTGSNTPTVELEYDTSPGKDGGPSTSVLTVWLSIAGVSMTFVQYHTSAPKSATGGSDTGKGIVKRMIRISVDQIPMLKSVPLVGQLPQPFDHLEYIWVEDDDPSTLDTTLKGIKRTELATITSMYPTDIPPFQVKDSLPPKEASTPDIVLQAGHHFVVVVSGKVVLDHVFGIAPPQPNTVQGQPSGNQLVRGQTGSGSGGAASSQAAEAKPTKGNAKLEVGPLSVTALSFQYKDECLYVVVDATLQLGPLTFSVIEFTIKLELSKVQLHHLASIVTDGLISASLHGIEVGVEQGALSLEGVFIHDVTTEAETYSGGIVVGFKAWQVLAIGQYMIKFPTATSEGFRAVFVYGKLDGPLVELEFATISGVRIGFGHNYAVRMPQIDELYKFPLICVTGASGNGNDPMKVLDAMVTAEPHFVYPKDGSDWFAAGMTITAFDVLTLTAVLVIDIDSGKTNSKDKGVILTLLADGVLQMEPGAPSDLTLFYVEIVVSFEMNFVAGYIAANATLTPASHVYVPQAHLTGGASFYTWFGQNSHAGDWVVTLGGYARGYDPPAHYPRPNRIGLNFTVGDNIHITGSLYVAVTPKCAMAGGSLNMSLSVGPVSAWCDVMLDAFINFKPFHFRAQISLSVGVECDIDILFIHIHISIHIGADLILWGPHDFGGHAHVDFWFFGFGIDFGASENSDARKAVSLDIFYGMVKSPGPASTPPIHDKIGADVDVALHKYSVEQGMIPASTPPADDGDFPSTGDEFQVQAGTLQIRIDCDFALSAAHIKTPNPNADGTFPPIQLPKGPDGKIPPVPKVYSRPMHSKAANDITSTLEVCLYDLEDDANPVLLDRFKAELVLKSAATAMWALYDPNNDPLNVDSGKPAALQNGDDATTNLAQAVRIFPPDPVLRTSPVVEFDATAAMREEIGDGWPFPAKEAQGGVFAGNYFEPEALDDDAAAQTQRWKDFGTLWSPDASSTATITAAPATPTLPNIRTQFVKQIASTLQWTIRPPAQMKANDGAAAVQPSQPPQPSTPANPAAFVAPTPAVPTSPTTLTTPVDPAPAPAPTPAPAPAPVPVTPNAPRVNEDGRTDWELLSATPVQLVQDLDKYYLALPFVGGVGA